MCSLNIFQVSLGGLFVFISISSSNIFFFFSLPEKSEVKTMMTFFLPVHFNTLPVLNQGTLIIGTFSRMYFFLAHHMK